MILGNTTTNKLSITSGLIINSTMMTITIPFPFLFSITTMAQDYSVLKGITMMMIVLLMKVYKASRRDISFVFSSWITAEGISFQQH